MNNTLILNPPFVPKRVSSGNWQLGLRLFWILGILSILVLLAFFVFQVIAETSERYLVQEYEVELNQVSRDSQNLELNLAKASSLESTIALMEKFNFEKVEKIHYIKVLSNQMVARKDSK